MIEKRSRDVMASLNGTNVLKPLKNEIVSASEDLKGTLRGPSHTVECILALNTARQGRQK